MYPLSWTEISCKNLVGNVSQIKKFLGKKKIAAVIKANAYGHGQKEVARILEDYVDFFQVDDLLELEKLRGITKKPTFVFGYVAKQNLREAVMLDGILGIYDIERTRILNQMGEDLHKKISIHIKIDTGLGRQGLMLADIEKYIRGLRGLKNIKVEGIYSHFANIEDTTDFSHAQKQIDAFKIAVRKFEKAGYTNLVKHMSATSGVLVYEAANRYFDMVRVGIGLYGLWPAEDLKERFGSKINLKPVMTWHSRIAQVKKVPKGFPIGYGLTYITPSEKTIAIIPQGYSDGYNRLLSNTGEVLVKGKRCKVLGRVAMNMFTADVSNIKGVKAEDDVVLLGRQGGEEITAEEIARKTDTINYEVVSTINPLLPRIVVDL